MNFAVKQLPNESSAKALKRAFKAANCSDIYGGELATYLNVIAQTLENQNETIAKLKASTKEYIKGIIS